MSKALLITKLSVFLFWLVGNDCSNVLPLPVSQTKVCSTPSSAGLYSLYLVVVLKVPWYSK
uniref:Uncharacterized protein n=1 Tax=Anguilla anguilla TaxID=7936 RepID=A0A0E9TYP8_ANGAN